MSYVLITGAALRIGRAFTQAFWQAGYDLILHYWQSEEAAQLLKEELEDQQGNGKKRAIILIKQNLLEKGAAQKIFTTLHQQQVFPEILINNASCYRRSSLKELTSEEILADFSLNFIAPLQLMQEMARQDSSGQIINLLDQRIVKVEANSGTYGLAKKTLKEATELAALEWAPNIRVNAIAPGLVLPPPGANPEKLLELLCNVPMHQQVSPEELAQAALFLSQQKNMTGQILYLDGGQHLAPIQKAEKETAFYKGK